MKSSKPSAPLVFTRADPVEFAKFDPATKHCDMNCGPAIGDPRSQEERKFLCDDCIPVKPKPQAWVERNIWNSLEVECLARDLNYVAYLRFLKISDAKHAPLSEAGYSLLKNVLASELLPGESISDLQKR